MSEFYCKYDGIQDILVAEMQLLIFTNVIIYYFIYDML